MLCLSAGGSELLPAHATEEGESGSPLSLSRLSRRGSGAASAEAAMPIAASTMKLEPFDGFSTNFASGAAANESTSGLGGAPISPALAGEYFRAIRSESSDDDAAAQVVAFPRTGAAEGESTQDEEQALALERAHLRVAAALPQSHRVVSAPPLHPVASCRVCHTKLTNASCFFSSLPQHDTLGDGGGSCVIARPEHASCGRRK